MTIALSIPIYRCDVAFMLESTIEDFEGFYKDNKDKMSEEEYKSIKSDMEDNDVAGAVFTCGVNYIVFIRNMKKKGHVDHELYHLTNIILVDRGVEHTRNDESFAYFNEYFHDEFRDIEKNHWKNRNKKEDDKTGTTGSGDSEQCKENKETEGGVHSGEELGARSTQITKMWRCQHIL